GPLEDEPPDPHPAPDDEQEFWLGLRARAQVLRDQATDTCQNTADLDALIGELDDELARAGIRGSLSRTTGDGSGTDPKPKTRRSRSTRRPQDTPDLPKRPRSDRTTRKDSTPPARTPS